MRATGNAYECRMKGPADNIPFSCTFLELTALQLELSLFLSTARLCR
jgi:hypothetical protein